MMATSFSGERSQKDWKGTYQGLPRQIGKTVSRSTQKDWKDIYQGLPRQIGKTVSRSTQKDWKDTYQGLPRQIGKALSRTLSLAAASRVHPFCGLLRRARTHAVLVIGLYELFCYIWIWNYIFYLADTFLKPEVVKKILCSLKLNHVISYVLMIKKIKWIYILPVSRKVHS
jgi:hypothetical protein